MFDNTKFQTAMYLQSSSIRAKKDSNITGSFTEIEKLKPVLNSKECLGGNSLYNKVLKLST